MSRLDEIRARDKDPGEEFYRERELAQRAITRRELLIDSLRGDVQFLLAEIDRIREEGERDLADARRFQASFIRADSWARGALEHVDKALAGNGFAPRATLLDIQRELRCSLGRCVKCGRSEREAGEMNQAWTCSKCWSER